MTEFEPGLPDVNKKLDLILEGWAIMRKDMTSLKDDVQHLKKGLHQLQIETRAVREMISALQVDVALVKRIV